MITPQYKGYTGVFDYDPSTQSYFGNATTQLLTFRGKTPTEAITGFQKAVDDYIFYCEDARAKIVSSSTTNVEDIKQLAEDIRMRLKDTTPAPWRWACWNTYYGEREPENILDRLVLEHSPLTGSQEAVVVEPDGESVKVLHLEESMQREGDAKFIAASRRDIEVLLGAVEVLLKENARLQTMSLQGLERKQRELAREVALSLIETISRQDDCTQPHSPDEGIELTHNYLMWMCLEIEANWEVMELDRLHRWIGWIQGNLNWLGTTTVEDEMNRVRQIKSQIGYKEKA